jgi:protein-glutamine gamma-glutamyltransferase
MNRPDRHTQDLIMAILVAMAPQILYLPFWVNLGCVFFWGHILFLQKKNKSLPPKWIQLVFAVMIFSAIIVTARGKFDSDSGVSLLCLMTSLKLYEVKKHRDRMLTVFLAYFMVTAGLFFSTSLEMTAYLFLPMVVITGILFRINQPDIPFAGGLRFSVSLVVRALPLAIIMFAVFPRLPGSLWGVQQKDTAQTGLSDTIYPGAMARLVENREVAFRVTFDRDIPQDDPLYWRAMVFELFDGSRWLVNRMFKPATVLPKGDVRVAYEMVVEPHADKWLFLLDYPAVFWSSYRLREDYTIQSRWKVSKQRRYRFMSYLTDHTGKQAARTDLLTKLPGQGNSKTREFAGVLYGKAGNVEAYVVSVLDYFNKQDFYYTLTPPQTGADSVDDFLFKTRKGYCEHYASAFVFLMRSVGIPARIVAGYMGGEVNPYGNYVIVRQLNAHAWAEVLTDARGWVRVDPTAAINPERVDVPMTRLRNSASDRDKGTGSGDGQNGVIEKLQLAWDAVNHVWYSTIVGYSTLSQERFLDRLGLSFKTIKDSLKVVGVALGLIIGITGIFYLGSNLVRRRSDDPVRTLYEMFLKKLEKAGIASRPHLGPVDYSKMAMKQRKDLEQDIGGITRIYILLRYGGQGQNRELLRQFRRRVHAFKPQRH